MIVLVVGLSGSGKSYLSERACEMSRELTHIKASDILRSGGYPITGLQSSDVSENQAYLSEKLKAEPEDKWIILDGHLLLETQDGPQLVPDKAFAQVPIRAIFFVVTDPKKILERRPRQDIWDAEEIADLAEIEFLHARRLARRKSLAFSTIQDGDVVDLLNKLDKVFRMAV